MGAFPLIVLVLMPLGNLLLLSSLEYLIVAEQEYVFQFYISTIITGDTIKEKTKESLISILNKYDYYQIPQTTMENKTKFQFYISTIIT